MRTWAKTEGHYRERRPEVRPAKGRWFGLRRPWLRHLQTGNRYRTRFVTQAPTASVTVAVPGGRSCRVVIEPSHVVKPGVCLWRLREPFRGHLITKEALRYGHEGAPGMGKDELDVWTARGGVADDQVYDDAGRIGGIFQRLSAHACQRIAAAGGFQRVSIDHGVAPVQFIEDWIEGLVTQPF